MPAIMWFRRDLRLADNPALLAAIEAAQVDGDGRVIPLFVVDPRLWESAGPVRQTYLSQSLDALGASIERNLLIRHGDPREVIAEVVRASNASSVHVASDFGPYGSRRDRDVEQSLNIPLVRTGSPYAVAPGRVTKGDGSPYRVFTPFYRAWLAHGWRAPAADIPDDVDWWMPIDCEGRPEPGASPSALPVLPTAGERAAWDRWEYFRSTKLADYDEMRNRPDVDGTSVLSHHLKYGEIHPRSLLVDLGDRDDGFRREICWRDFYADVLHQQPDSVRASLDVRYDMKMRWNDDDALFEAWAKGRTGFPFVDAGMRQLRAEGWMHNRVRMVVASFLVKDLHIRWQLGAAEFMRWLRDGDLASNTHGWQWTAGCGTDAAPFYRIFNPISQGLKFDPEGDYVRRYIPELRHLPGKSAHEPWSVLDGYEHGYPEPIVDHKVEREAALADFAALKRS